MIVQGGEDKRSISGFFHIALAYSVTMSVAAADARHHNFDARILQCYLRLIEAMNKYTDVKTEFLDRIPFDSEELLDVPWIYAASGTISFHLTESEAQNLGRYVTSGGFLLLDHLAHRKGLPGDLALRDVFRDGLAAQGYTYGVHWEFEILPNAHNLYHCFFDFDNGPPRSWSPQGGYGMGEGQWNSAPPDPTLEGVHIENRLVGIMSNQAFANAWGDWNNPAATAAYMGLDPTRPLQFGVNTIVFALTQEGSITNRVMDIMR